MKRIVITSLLVVSGLGLFAQSTSKAKDLLKSKKLSDAKSEIDKVVTNEKGAKDPEAWYIKSKVYSELANDTTQGNPMAAREESFQALKKYTELDDKKLVYLTLDNYKPIMDVYQGYFKSGAAYYNSNNYADAYNNFKKCLEVSQYMNEKGWSNLKLDTSVILYAGISAEKTNKKEEAAQYYSKLADAKVNIEGVTLELNKWLTDYYNSKKDTANAAKYLAIGKSLYPKDTYWTGMELDMARENGDKKQLFSKYEEIISKEPTNYLYPYNYGIEMYQEAYKEDATQRPANADELIDKAAVNIKKALDLKPDYAPANLVLGQIYFNQGVDASTKAKAIKTPATGKLKPEDQKTKDEMKALMLKKFDEAVPYLEKVDQIFGSQGKLKMDEKKNLKDAYDLLITIYDQKGQKDKLKVFEDKFNAVDKAH